MRSKSITRKSKKQLIIKRRILMACIAIIIFLLGGVVFGSFYTINAQGNTAESPVAYKYYKSIEIKPGDTLWSLAKEYMHPSKNESIKEYIKELKRINHLQSDDIQDSNYLTVAYYDSEFK